MKGLAIKSILGVVLLVAIYAVWFIVGSSKGISWISTIGAPTVKTTVYNLEMAGYDGRLYTFTKDGKDCMAVATSEGVGVTCSEQIAPEHK